jgi:hypothetical protein
VRDPNHEEPTLELQLRELSANDLAFQLVEATGRILPDASDEPGVPPPGIANPKTPR